MSVDTNDVLALLEDGPKDQADLTIWLGRQDLNDEQNAQAVTRALRRIKRAGLVKRVGGRRLWALASYVAKTGRPARPETQRARRSDPPTVPAAPAPVRALVAVSAPQVILGRTRIIDGVEYELVDYEGLLRKTDEDWPSRGGSSLGVYDLKLGVIR